MSDTIKIDKDVPTPPPRARYMHWPFNDLQIGDSFLVPVTDGSSPHYWQSRILQASRRYKNGGQKYASRKVDGGVRVWRTE